MIKFFDEKNAINTENIFCISTGLSLGGEYTVIRTTCGKSVYPDCSFYSACENLGFVMLKTNDGKDIAVNPANVSVVSDANIDFSGCSRIYGCGDGCEVVDGTAKQIVDSIGI